jgi:hypothetical protein
MLAMTAARRSRPTIAKPSSTARSSSRFRGPSRTVMHHDSAKQRSAYMRNSGSSATALRDRLTATESQARVTCVREIGAAVREHPAPGVRSRGTRPDARERYRPWLLKRRE